MPEGGLLRLTVSREEDRIRFVVEDTGPGMTPEALERAFEPFFTTKEHGTGLGLSIAFQIADRHGGDLRAENIPAGGARLTLEIPVQAVEEE
jgi:signal transduction histidine kinase